MIRRPFRAALCLAFASAGMAFSVPAWFPRGFRTAKASDPVELRGYLATEDLAIADSIHRFGTVRVGALEIACQTWIPARARGTVFLVHGYYNHTGIWAPHIRRFLSEGWAVASLDLPGHGLSDGRPFDVDSVGEYADALVALEDSLRGRAPRPWTVVGHSLGGLVVLDRAGRPDYPYRNTVLLAPMVHFSGWTWIGTVLPAVSLFKDRMVRGKALNSSSDSAFLRRVERDPLEGWTTPVHWLEEVRIWNARSTAEQLAPSRWFYLQGDQDRTVDWRYDIDWVAARTRGMHVRMFKGARHHLQDEGGPLGVLVRETLDSAIGGSLPSARK
ncbi:MAG TPA: alpha/beta hydrolase [Fibrobacteria bacterium]|nr:alpha/beta hydrolase [Fibrobacteria bacterium]